MTIATANKLILLLLLTSPFLAVSAEVKCENAGPMTAWDWRVTAEAIRDQPAVMAAVNASTNNGVSYLSELSISDREVSSIERSLSKRFDLTEKPPIFRVRSRVDRDFKSAVVVGRTEAFVYVKPNGSDWTFVRKILDDGIHRPGPLFDTPRDAVADVFFKISETNVISSRALKRSARNALAEKLNIDDTSILHPHIIVTGVTNVAVSLGEPNSTWVRRLPLRHDGSFGPMTTNHIRLNQIKPLTPDDILNP